MRALALAEELEVSVRTIDRDIDELSGAGPSDDCDHGGNGGVRLEDGYRTKLTGMTASEWGCYRPQPAIEPPCSTHPKAVTPAGSFGAAMLYSAGPPRCF